MNKSLKSNHPIIDISENFDYKRSLHTLNYPKILNNNLRNIKLITEISKEFSFKN